MKYAIMDFQNKGCNLSNSLLFRCFIWCELTLVLQYKWSSNDWNYSNWTFSIKTVSYVLKWKVSQFDYKWFICCFLPLLYLFILVQIKLKLCRFAIILLIFPANETNQLNIQHLVMALESNFFQLSIFFFIIT